MNAGDSEEKGDRRRGDRRDDERRTFREEEGRRDPERNRRQGLRRFVLPMLLVALPLVLLFAWRTAFVAPRWAAEVRCADAGQRIAPILAQVRLPMLALVGSGEPAPGEPDDPLPELAPRDRAVLQEVNNELTPSLLAAPTVAAVPGHLAVAHLLQGRELQARRSWETELARGAGDELYAARVGLAVLAIRAGLRADDAGDRAFALEEALRHLDRVPGGVPEAAAADFDRAVALDGRSLRALPPGDE